MVKKVSSKNNMLVSNSEIEVWDRQPEELPSEYNLFSEYRDTGLTGAKRPTIRSFAKEREFQPSYVYEISNRWRWADRLTEYDKYLEKRHRANLEKRQTQVIDRSFDRTMRLFNRLHDTVDAIIDAATQVALNEGIQFTTPKDKDGDVEVRVKVSLDADTMKSLAQANKILVDTLRTAVGLPTTISSSSLNVKHEISAVEKFILDRSKLLDGETSND